MRTNSVSIFMGDTSLRQRHTDNVKNGSSENNVVGFGQGRNAIDPLKNIKELAKKKALKVVGDAYKAEQQVDDDVKARREKIRELSTAVNENKKEIQSIEEKIETLKKTYGIDEDSKEYEETRVLLKDIDSKLAGSRTTLTDEEKATLENIDMDELTEYQKRAMELKYSEAPYAKKADDAAKSIEDENAVLRQIKIERNKSHSVADAQKQAKQIQENARKEIINTLVDEGKTHVEETMDKQFEEAKERAKEKEEREERIEEIKAATEDAKELAEEIREDKERDSEHLIEDILESSGTSDSTADSVDEAQNKVKDMMRKMKLIEDDLKGTTVDQSL